MYPDDEMPPHFHVRTPHGDAKVRIGTLEIFRGRLRRADIRTVIDWATKNREVLITEWNRLNERD
jgi:hypothetical protein